MSSTAGIPADIKAELDDAFQFFTGSDGCHHTYVTREWVEAMLVRIAAEVSVIAPAPAKPSPIETAAHETYRRHYELRWGPLIPWDDLDAAERQRWMDAVAFGIRAYDRARAAQWPDDTGLV